MAMRKRSPLHWFDSPGKLLIGVVHLRPLPGSPRWDGNFEAVVKTALSDALAYERGGADALAIENFGDVPFTRNAVPPETVASMAVVGAAVRAALRLPIGFNVLRNDPHSGLALCAACSGAFLRVNVHVGSMVTDQGLIEGDAFSTLRLRCRLAPRAKILADVHVKHGVPLGNIPIGIAARDSVERGLADGVIVSGTGTGVAADLEEVRAVRSACVDARIFLGSGVTAENIAYYREYTDGVIVGTSVKRGGKVANPVDERRVQTLSKALKAP